MLTDLAITPPPHGLEARIRRAIDLKTKPPGSLGRIEALALRLGLALGSEAPAADPAVLLLFAGDHGLVAEGVSAWPQAVTAQMVANFLAGGAAANAFARAAGAELRLFDAGVAGPLAPAPGLRQAGIRAGTRNAAREDALTAAEVTAALRFGADAALAAAADGAQVIALGEMGIGNSSAAALLGAAVSGIALDRLVGPGAGLGAGGLDAKRAALLRAAARRPGRLAPEAALAAFGGLEIAAMAGAVIGAASAGRAVVVDGFITTAAALAALAARPEARPFCIFAHRSAEPGHDLLLAHLGERPLLDLELRLGEGTGALLALPLIRAAAAMLREMASFADAGVSEGARDADVPAEGARDAAASAEGAPGGSPAPQPDPTEQP
ncbi:nicotinate-nucleotide--dimethylbenzimidazole phosphoribosyltransferase [Paralimibaculum aggregatum]|uniref:Nicotinate-nucleotide--dimethylbenzimidazole phosphoribosyltransferase n=1 Tax=Paralimibaculum aggregatum TaxID=3036245 RepID=A0ABQ6LK84_9RHOB|nr:nicotinate-nucleotide--dimethylbenzimidazole phosphoribosyltransferase [Limibaculum sp. NKW23]GMG81059.1 nicotinate-nucleotide--dimethylbenzimidazole phosphoribosyltransferase [Limibaculum sp. NKW23]